MMEVHRLTGQLLCAAMKGESSLAEFLQEAGVGEDAQVAAIVIRRSFETVANLQFSAQDSVEEITVSLRHSIERWGDCEGLLRLREVQALVRAALGEERLWNLVEIDRAAQIESVLFVNLVRDLNLAQEQVERIVGDASNSLGKASSNAEGAAG